MSRLADLTGQRFGKLKVLARDQREGFGTFWLCQCDCNRVITARAGNLIGGNTKSCGCAKRKSTRNTNYEKTRPRAGDTRISWELMLNRCYNVKSHNYPLYGAVGVTVCQRWIDSYENFVADMGERPLGTTIDRHPNPHGNYEPGNCRWATPQQQSNNRRDNVILEAFGRKQTLKQWSEEYKVPTSTILGRLKKHSVEQALTMELYQGLMSPEAKEFYRNRKSTFFIEAFGQRKALVEWAEEYGLAPTVLSARIRKRGMTPEQALTTPIMPRGSRHKGMQSCLPKKGEVE